MDRAALYGQWLLSIFGRLHWQVPTFFEEVGGGAALDCFVVVFVVIGGGDILDLCVDAADLVVVLDFEGGGEAALVLVVDACGFVEELKNQSVHQFPRYSRIEETYLMCPDGPPASLKSQFSHPTIPSQQFEAFGADSLPHVPLHRDRIELKLSRLILQSSFACKTTYVLRRSLPMKR
jgi:hypothetical protein